MLMLEQLYLPNDGENEMSSFELRDKKEEVKQRKVKNLGSIQDEDDLIEDEEDFDEERKEVEIMRKDEIRFENNSQHSQY
jgi:hypothetical protein